MSSTNRNAYFNMLCAFQTILMKALRDPIFRKKRYLTLDEDGYRMIENHYLEYMYHGRSVENEVSRRHQSASDNHMSLIFDI